MNEAQAMVREFEAAMGYEAHRTPAIPNIAVQVLRLDLIDEEVEELSKALRERDLVEVADAIGDILYVVYGTALACGIDIEPIFKEIHRSNMTKVGAPKYVNGKQSKGDNYSPPNLVPILANQTAK